MNGCNAGHQEVGMCSTRGGSQGKLHYIHLHKKANKAEPTLALKPRGDVTRNPKQGYKWTLITNQYRGSLLQQELSKSFEFGWN